MLRTVNSRKCAFFAAGCYAGFALFTILTGIRTYTRNGVMIPLAAIGFWLLLIGVTATILLRRPKAVVVMAGLSLLREVLYFIGSWTVVDAAGVIAAVALLVILIFALKGSDHLQDFWFVPAVAMLEKYALGWYYTRFFVYFSKKLALRLVFSLMEVAALALLGLWLKKRAEEKGE